VAGGEKLLGSRGSSSREEHLGPMGSTTERRHMDRKTQARFEARARIIKAMAHPTRLFIVEELSGKERCVRELTKMIGADVSTVSKHLSILRNAGIVEDEKRGSQVFYALKMPCVLKFFSCVETVIESRAKEQLKCVR
jgi:ArsR family transcriptional regulator